MSVQVKKRLLTVDEYHAMARAGILGKDDRVELYERLERRLAVAGLRSLRERWRAAGLNARDLRGASRRLLEERAEGRRR